MIFIVVKFETKPEWTDRWPDLVASFTAATRAEAGNLWFEWSRSVEDPNQYVLLEAFRDGDAGAAHVQSGHFASAIRELPSLLARVPDIVNVEVPGTEWSELAEMASP
jgi:quinol monooxygenase YgiN